MTVTMLSQILFTPTVVYRQCVPQPHLTVEAEQHDPLAAKSVWEAAEDNAAKHHTAEVDGGDEGRDVGPVTNKFPLKYRVYTYMQIQGWLSFIVHLECRGFTGLQGLFGLPKTQKASMCSLLLPQKVLKECWRNVECTNVDCTLYLQIFPWFAYTMQCVIFCQVS